MIEPLRYPTGTKLAGVVLVQLLGTYDNADSGSALCQSIEALKELCGDTTLKNVIIMTHHWNIVKPEVERRLNSDLSPGGWFHPAIEQGAQVYHYNEFMDCDLGALRIILQDRPVAPKVQQGRSGDIRRLGENMQKEIDRKVEELRREPEESIRKESRQELKEEKRRALREEDLLKKHIAEMQAKEESTRKEFYRELEEQKRRAREEADGFRKRIAEMESKEEIARKEIVREHRRELKEQERRAQEKADGLRDRISEMQSKLEEDRHTSGKAIGLSAHSFPPHLKTFLVGPCAHLAIQRVYPSIDLHPNSRIVSTTHFTGKSMNNVCKTSGRTTLSGSLNIWTRYVTMSPFLTGRSSTLALQALDSLDPLGPASRKCLRELGSICATHAILPTSCSIPSHLLTVDSHPFASGAFGEVYRATLGNSLACVKRLRAAPQDDLAFAIKVRCQHHHFSYS